MKLYAVYFWITMIYFQGLESRDTRKGISGYISRPIVSFMEFLLACKVLRYVHINICYMFVINVLLMLPYQICKAGQQNLLCAFDTYGSRNTFRLKYFTSVKGGRVIFFFFYGEENRRKHSFFFLFILPLGSFQL